ncbi:winged helix-turn-helix domain-containing protein [Vibrio lentus]|uniref:winged helix-turn-helix domain-containing protein n=1 Tax=Vibrio lentus TaxID=136468 RepID=UPI002468C377|nr:winged helix-turn-helix domain-containing protein [Vibrio lentus]MDH5929408.1 winged helix-turn-helix domain-containing protein [Vibrio lentus]
MRTSYSLGNNITFSYPKREIQTDTGVIKLGGREANIMLLLLESPNTLLSKQFINDEVWGNILVAETSLTKAISNIRKALAHHLDINCELKTFPKQGYMLAIDNDVLEPTVISDEALHSESISPNYALISESEAPLSELSGERKASFFGALGLLPVAFVAFSASIVTVLAEVAAVRLHLF